MTTNNKCFLTRVGQLHIVAVPDEHRLRVRFDFALEAETLSVGVWLDEWLLREARRHAVFQAECIEIDV